MAPAKKEELNMFGRTRTIETPAGLESMKTTDWFLKKMANKKGKVVRKDGTPEIMLSKAAKSLKGHIPVHF